MSAPDRISGRVLFAGDVMTDLVVRPEGPVIRGSDRRATISLVPGGSAANQAVWLATAGTQVALFARVGEDDRDVVEARLREAGVEPLISGDAERQSGRLITIVDTDGERSFFTDRGANPYLNYADLSPHWRANTGLVVLSGYSFFTPHSRTCAMRMLGAAIERHIPVAVDAASAGFLAESGERAFLEWTEGATLFVANADEAKQLTGEAETEAQLAALVERFPRVVIKDGAAGSHALIRGEAPVFAKAKAIDAIDSTGAGDAFLAGFIAAWRQGETLKACLETGNRFGACAVEQVGGQPRRDPNL